MKYKIISRILFLHLTILILTACASRHLKNEALTDNKLIAEGATPQLISNQFSFTEGPTADQDGNIFFTDQPNDKIWKYGTDGKLTVFMDKTGRANGLFFDKSGNLLSCSDENNEIWSIDKKGNATVLLKDYKGSKLNGPNDLWVHPSGSIYFTDPYYQRDYWTRKQPEIEGQKVYYMAKGISQPEVATDSLKKPNGLIGTPDGTKLYVSDIEGNKIYRFTINKDGTLKDQQLFVEQGGDGMTIDNQGNIYLAGKGVTVFDPTGKKIEEIVIPEPWTANLCFGGKDKNLLFITASKAVYTLKMRVKGV